MKLVRRGPARKYPPCAATNYSKEVRLRQRLCGSLTACILVALAWPCTATGDALSDMRKSGRMQWGGDQEGGGPYVFPQDKDPSQVTGFEVDLANRIGEYLKL